MTKLQKAFGAAARRLREERTDLSQDRFGAEAGISRTYYWEVENARTTASLETIYKVARTLGISMGQLLDATEEELGEFKAIEPKFTKPKTDSPPKAPAKSTTKRSPKKRR